jgi:hypothetical protein
MGLPSPWTPERVQQLRSMLRAGHTPAEIAKTMGPPITRFAVLGKARRLRVAGALGACGARPDSAPTGEVLDAMARGYCPHRMAQVARLLGRAYTPPGKE